MNFGSWIPSLTGRVSFRKMGEDTDNAHGRYVMAEGKIVAAALGKHFSSDHKFKTPFTDIFFRRTGYFNYLIIAKSSPKNGIVSTSTEFVRDRELTGWVFLHPATFWLWRLMGFQSRRDFSFEVNAYSTVAEIDRLALGLIWHEKNVSSVVQSSFRRWNVYRIWRESLYKISYYSVPFIIKKNGEVFIKVAPFCVGPTIRSYSSTNAILDTRNANNLALSVFNIIRDRFHRHKHHNYKSDTIIGVHPSDGGDGSWRLRLVAQLLEKARSFHNFSYYEDQTRAQGIVSYIGAYLSILNKHENKNVLNGFEPSNSGDLEDMRRSISAKESRIYYYRSIKIIRYGAFVAFMGVIAAVLAVNDEVRGSVKAEYIYILLFLSACFAGANFFSTLTPKAILSKYIDHVFIWVAAFIGIFTAWVIFGLDALFRFVSIF